MSQYVMEGLYAYFMYNHAQHVTYLSARFHGYKYIAQMNRTITERLIWAGVVVASLCCSLIFMQIAWEYNSSHSTLTVIESTHHGIWNFPFPAITICNNNQVSLRKTRQFVDNLTTFGGLTRDYILEEMRLLIEILDPGAYNYNVDWNLTILQDVFDANNYTISDVMKLVNQDCTSLLRNCKWKGNSTPCHELFEQTYARDGICCSFNYFNSENRSRRNIEPKKLTACGYQTGLSFLADPEPNDYHSSLYGFYGIKVMLHYPYSYPDRSTEFQLVSLGVQNFLGISPEETYSTRGVLELQVRDRDCIFSEKELSKELKLLKKNYTWIKYTYTNCLNECRANTTITECGCVPYYIPQNGNRVCNLRDVQCLKRIRVFYDTPWPGLKMNSSNFTDFEIDISNRPCACLPDCRLYRYPVDSTQGILRKSILENHKTFSDMDVSKNTSLVNIFFTDLVSIQYRRDIYYNWRNLCASFGGLLGLFVGFSLMTGIELVYFFVVRVIADKCKNGRKIETDSDNYP
ncbi:sodium channel protein Nach-like [Copidosoma floridanum]|uniref:sodium channel protein Nach-like n=1 Tax=Copidosoma floridanum TaxID=29053 RepID=UPI0006C9A816|nr:sodium channel protein Nach-like [Copidosoma floridanum]